MKSFLKKHEWSIITCLFIIAFVFGCAGFLQNKYQSPEDALYETFSLFDFNHPFEYDGANGICIEIGRWLAFGIFLWVSFRAVFTLIVPKWWTKVKVKNFYKGHVIICGLTNMTMSLIEILRNEKYKVVVVASEIKESYFQTLKAENVKLIVGNPIDFHTLASANPGKASKMYAITDDDRVNIEATQVAFSLLQKEKHVSVLRCFTMVRNNELKSIIEDTELFKFHSFFNGVVLNVNELGMKYYISKNIDRIISPQVEKPNILLINLNDKSESVILNLAHLTTMKEETFNFVVVEENKDVIKEFMRRYNFLKHFINIEFVEDIDKALTNCVYQSIFVCSNETLSSITTANYIRNHLKSLNPYVFIFIDEANSLHQTLDNSNAKRNIKMIIPLKIIAEYIFNLDKDIERFAKMSHQNYESNRKKLLEGKFEYSPVEYEHLSEHFKQSNRNQILDFYLKLFISKGMLLDSLKGNALSVFFTEQEVITLSKMEHRRWCVEKYMNGWEAGQIKDVNYKITPCFKDWEDLPLEEQDKDRAVIMFMNEIVNSKLNDTV
jgi:Trk K+ transport system NAD-binding subunit